MKKYEVAGRKLYMMFVDVERVFDRVLKEIIWWALRRKGVMEREIKAMKEMYMNIRACVKVESMRSKSFDVKVGVHQESIPSALLLAVVINEIRKGVVKELLYANDLVLLGDDWEEVESQYSP